MESFAAHVTRRRRELGLSRTQLARRVALSGESIRQIEIGERPAVHEENALRLAAALEEPFEVLEAVMRGEEPPAADPEPIALSTPDHLDISDLAPEDQAAVRRVIENARARHRDA